MRGKPYATCRAKQHYSDIQISLCIPPAPPLPPTHRRKATCCPTSHWFNWTWVSPLSWESSERLSLFPGLNVTFWSRHVGTVMCSALSTINEHFYWFRSIGDSNWELLRVNKCRKNCTSIQCFAHVWGQSMVCERKCDIVSNFKAILY